MAGSTSAKRLGASMWIAWAVCDCGSSPPPPSAQPAMVASTTLQPSPRTPSPRPPSSHAPSTETIEPPQRLDEMACPSPGHAGEAAVLFQRAKRLLDESRDEGDHYEVVPFDESMDLFRRAAAMGHLEAQFKYGSELFGAMFTNQAPTSEEEEDYVRALTYLRLAALRGHRGVKSYFEGIDRLRIDEKTGKLSGSVPFPFDTLPRAWVQRAVVQSDALAACR